MVYSFYKILDKNGVEIPDHWSGRRRTYDEAKKMVDVLNKNGEHRPYTMIEINGNMAQQTAMQIMYDELIAHEYTIPISLIVKCKELIEMEKEQSESICVNVIEAILDKVEKGEDVNSKFIFEQYYNETYNK